MKSFILVASLGLFSCSFLLGQSEEALAVYDQMTQKLNNYKQMNANIELMIKYPDGEETISTGEFVMLANRTYLDLGNIRFITDGKTSWTILKERNEAQIEDVDEDFPMVANPISFINYFFDDNATYDIVEKDEERLVMEIKPGDRDSEYAKARIELAKSDLFPKKMFVFQKDGVVMTFKLEDYDFKTIPKTSMFKFNKADYPNIYVEDLRLD